MSFSAIIQNFDDWYCIFNSSIEPRGEYIQLLPDLIKWVRLFYINQIQTIFDQENSEKLATSIIPDTIKKFLNFSDLQNDEVKNINQFFIECAEFAFFAIKNNIKQSFPSLISLFDSSCIYYQKNDFYQTYYDQIVQNFINQVKNQSDSFESLDDYSKSDHQDDLDIYYALFLISHNLLKIPKYRDFTYQLISKMLNYFYAFLKNVKNLRELNINYLKEIFNAFFEDMTNIVDESCIFKFLDFFIRCLKSDYLDKQLFAAEQIVGMCDKPKLFESLLNYNSKEVDLIDLIISNNFHFEVMSILNKFITQMANQKMLTIQHLIQLWDKSQNLHISERKIAFDLISKCFDFFDETELESFIEYLYNKKNESNDVSILLSNAVLAIQHKENVKELSLDIVNHLLEDISSTETQNGILSICSSMISQDIIKLIAHKVVFYICDKDLIDFTLSITLKLIKSSNIVNNIFNDDYINNLINLILVDDENQFDNRKAIFQILDVLYTTSSLKPNSDILKKIISIKKDNIVWDFLRKLLIVDGIVKTDQSEPIEEAVKSQDLQSSTINFAKFLIAFIFYMNRSMFLNAKLNDDYIESFHLESIELNYFDLLFDMYLESEDNQVSNEAKDFILKIYTNCNRISFSTKDIQQRVCKIIDDSDESKKLKMFTLLYEYLQISEVCINPEDFDMPNHKFSKKLIKMVIIDSDGNKVQIHINPKSTVNVLKSRISVIAKSKIDYISIQQLDYERDDKLIENLKLSPPNEVRWHFKSLMKNRQIFEPPPSCELHKTHFSDCLLDILDQQCSEETAKIVWKLLKYLPTNEKAISDISDFDSFFTALYQSKNVMKFRYYLQIFLHKYSHNQDNEEEEEEDDFQSRKNEYLTSFVDLFKDKRYPKKELLQIFIIIFKFDDIFEHAQLIIPELLWCISRDPSLSSLVNKIFTGFLKMNPIGTSEILMHNSINLTETIHSLKEKDWPIFLNLLSNSLNLGDVTDMCIDELSDEGENTRFFLKLSTKIIPKLKIKSQTNNEEEEENEEEENEENVIRFIKLFNISIDFFNEDKNINDALNLLIVLIQRYPKLLQKNSKSKEIECKQIPIEKIISIAFDDPPDELQTVIFTILNEIIKNCQITNENEDLALIRNQIDKIISITIDRWNYDPSIFRKTEPYVGLRNLGSTCFVNSVLQQLFHLYPVRVLLLMHKFEPTDSYTNLQHLFDQMMFTERSFCDPSIFIGNWKGWYGSLINTREQQDSFELYNIFINEDTEYHFPTEVTTLFREEVSDIVKGVNESFSSKKIDINYCLNLGIKGFKNINESFNEYNQIQTCPDYGLENPKRKIAVHKSSRISKPPVILTIQLKRFEYDYKNCTKLKINDKFEFPDDLDISCICDFEQQADEKENDPYILIHSDCLYELHGVIVHTGSANGGHYLSIVNINHQYYLFNDSEVSIINRETFEKTCYGDNVDKTSAYLLFYIRKGFKETINIDDYKSLELSFNENPEITNILKTERFSENIKADNILFKTTQSLFKIPVIDFIMDLNDFEINLKYFINILCHSKHVEKSSQFQDKLNKIIDKKQKEVEFINYLIDHFNEVFNNYLNCYDLNIMKNFNKVVIHCLRNIIIHERHLYRSSKVIEINDEKSETENNKKISQNRLLPFILCDKIYIIISNHINAFRQMPLILSIIEFCISMDPGVSYKSDFGFNWFEKIAQLINNIYGVQRTSQFLTNSDYSLLFKSLISIIKAMPQNSVDCTFLFAHMQNILKSESNQKDFIDLLLLSSKNQNIDIVDIFSNLSQLNNYPRIICNYFIDLVCTSNNYREIISDIYKFITLTPGENSDVVICSDSKTENKMLERCVQIIYRFNTEIESNSSIFISNFLKFSPYMVHDLITFNDEFVRTQCEDLYYKIFKSCEKLSSKFSFDTKQLTILPSYLRDSSKIYNNALEPFLNNIEDYLSKLTNLHIYYPGRVKTNNKLYGFDSNEESSYNDSSSTQPDERKFKLLSILRIYRWIVYSMHKEWENQSFYSINSDSFTAERADFVINLIQRFARINYHPDYNIRYLLLLLGEFPVEILQNNFFRSFKFIFEQYDKSDFTIHSIQVEFEPFIRIMNHYQDEEDLQSDIISIFLNEVFSKNIFPIFQKNPMSQLLSDLIPIMKAYKDKYSEIIDQNEDFNKLLKELSLKNSVTVKNHYTMSKSGGLIQQEVNRNLRKDDQIPTEIFDDMNIDDIMRFVTETFEFLLKENVTSSVKNRIYQFMKEVHPSEELDENLIFFSDKELKHILKAVHDADQNLICLFEMIKWTSRYSPKTQKGAKKLIQEILSCTSNSEIDVLITQTAKFAAAFDFKSKINNLLRDHYNRIKMNHSPNIRSFGPQKNKKMKAFLDSLSHELEKAEKGEIEWMKEFAEFLIKNEDQNQLKKLLISKLLDNTILDIFFSTEREFKESTDMKETFAKTMLLIIKESNSEIREEIKERSSLTEFDFASLKHLQRMFKSLLLDETESSKYDDEK